MAIRTLKLFVVGPHREDRYRLIREYITRMVAARADAHKLDVSIVTPEQNPSSDRFNDWIFGQIDTCDMLVADLTGFNPNVVYEVTFAHSLGVPCAYLRFDDPGSETDADHSREIKHYFKFTLLPHVTEGELRSGQNAAFNGQLSALFDGRPVSGKTILSDYYDGVSPVDAEFVRGLAEGYYRNFLYHLLHSEPPEAYAGHPFRILIPDTFERPDADVRRTSNGVLKPAYIELKETNTLGRPLKVSHTRSQDEPFFFDVPTTLLTITRSSKYIKIDRAEYFDDVDRDRLTDRLARRFVEALWVLIRSDRDKIQWPLDRFEIVWLSEAIGSWAENEALMNTDSLARPDRL